MTRYLMDVEICDNQNNVVDTIYDIEVGGVDGTSQEVAEDIALRVYLENRYDMFSDFEKETISLDEFIKANDIYSACVVGITEGQVSL